MSKVAELTTLIAGREFKIRNLHVKHLDGRVCGADFDLHFLCGHVEEFKSGTLERLDLEQLIVWLYREMSGDRHSAIEVVGQWGTV